MSLAIAGAGVSLALGSCSLALSPGEDQCETDADCEARGFSGATCVDRVCEDAAEDDPIWGCLGNVTEPLPDTSKTVELSVRLLYATGEQPVKDAVVDVCDNLDVDCSSDDPKFPKGLSPDADGYVKVSVVQGFDGFVRITDPTIVDSRVYVGRPIVEPPKVKAVRLLKPSEVEALAAVAQSPVDHTRGTAIILAVDCQGDAASGVSFQSPNADGDSKEFYLIGQAPTTPPNATFTDVDGFGGFFNVAPGAAVARSFRASDDAYIGESSFLILADTISYVQIAPTPQ